ncbi:MAG: TonB family protein, partial [Catalinimonas sp.]
MLAKKDPTVDLRRYTGAFFAFGLTVALLLVLTAFEWKTYDPWVNAFQEEDLWEEEALVQIPNTQIVPPPPPRPQLAAVVEAPDEVAVVEMKDVEIEDLPQTDPAPGPALPPPPLILVNCPPTHEEEDDKVFIVVEEQAHPQGGFASFYEYLSKHLRYPEQARRMGVEGRVFVQFVVERDGTLTDVQAVKGIGAGCDEEA